ncbi:MAG TPA: ABC transporter ATP-binding protein [Mycobacteriales bacterium]|nr:ABC transporter ATP-binding protein [Mycobacteriales bacterium]
MIGSGIAVLLTYLVGQVVGAAQVVATGGPARRFALFAVVMGLAFLVNSIVPVLRMALTLSLGLKVGRAAAVQTVAPLLEPGPIGHLDDPRVQDIYGRATTEAQLTIESGATMAAFMLGGRLSLIGSAALLVSIFHWWVTVVLLLSNAFTEWLIVRMLAREAAVWRGQTESQRMATYLFDLSLLHGPKEIRIFGLSGWLTARHRAAHVEAFTPVWRRRRRGAVVNVLNLLPHVAICAGALALAGKEAFDGRLSLTTAATVLPAILAVSNGFQAGSVWSVRRGLQTLRAMNELRPTIAARHPRPAGCSYDFSGAPRREIRFEDVSFRYPGSNHDVLCGLNLTIRADEALALVGVNGAGKSTLVKLLAGCHQPTAGRVTVDGIDLATLDEPSLAGWQRRVATIVQDFLRLPLSARDNVEFGSAPEDSAAIAAADRAGALEMIEALPESWDTTLDKSYSGGVDLSGGQWQRLALARALRAVDGGARLLVLDEPAAALDVRSEAALVENYLDLTAGLASLIISHRFSVVRGADRICVLGEGRILESGTHDELIAAGGRYATMFGLQADRYRDVEAADA